MPHAERLNGCKTGNAKITKGHRLPARFIVHTVGPVWNGGDAGEPELLVSCYRQSLELAAKYEFATLAFPAISTGIFRYPPDAAAEIAVKTTAEFLSLETPLREVIFCCFDAASFARH